MRRDSQTSKRYASALFELTTACGSDGHLNPQKLTQELQAFAKTLHDQDDLKKFFLNPSFSREEKKEILEELKDKLSESFKFLNLLIEANRLNLLSEIITEFEKQLQECSGELSVDLEVAHKMNEDSIREISEILETQWKRKPKFNLKLNPALIGGFVAKAPGRTYDASVRSQLRAIEQNLTA